MHRWCWKLKNGTIKALIVHCQLWKNTSTCIWLSLLHWLRYHKILNTVTMYCLVLHFDQRLVYFHTLLKRIFIGHSFRTTLSSKKVVSKTINRFTHLENDTIKSIALSLKTNDRQTCKYWCVAKQVFFLSGASEASSMDGGSRSSWQRVNKPLPVASMSEDNVCGWEINISPRSEVSRANVKFWRQSLSQGHYHPIYDMDYCNLRICSCLACLYRVMDARGKFGENEKCVRVARGAAESNFNFLIVLQTSQVHP